MTEQDKFDVILFELRDMKEGIQELKSDMADVNANIRDIRHAAGSLEQKAAASGLHIENVTDPSIQLIAENFIELTNKLNPAIPAADKNLAYEVKVNYLVCEVNNLKTGVDKLKNQSA